MERITERIVEAIQGQLETGVASLEGLRLPPIRVLAHQLGVSKNTVNSAYEELKSRGLVESRGKSGLFVMQGSPGLSPARPKLRVPAPAFKPLPVISVQPKEKPGALWVSAVFIDPRILPREKLTACFRSVLKKPGLVNFPDRQGFLPLRRAIADRLKKRGIEARAEDIVTTVGSQQVLDLVYRSLSSNRVATENPAYYVGKVLFEMNRMETIPLPINPFHRVDFREWERILAKKKPGLAYLTSNFQNPTGFSYTSAELAKILELSMEHGFGILEDDWGSDMLSFSEFKPSLRALGGSNVLYMNSFTKKVLPSLRVGYVLGNEETVPSLTLSKRVSIGSAPSINEVALFEFLDRGYYDAYLKKVQTELDRRYQACLKLLSSSMPEEVRWTTPGGGPVLWLEIPKRVDLKKLTHTLAERGVLIQSSETAFFGKPHLNGFKIGYAFLSIPEMERCLDILSDQLKRELA